MNAIKTDNGISILEPYLNTRADGTEVLLKTMCQICQKRGLRISSPAQAFSLVGNDQKLTDKHVEQAVLLPCGHIFGHSCLREKMLEQEGLTCGSCGFQMKYTQCGHAIAPVIICQENERLVGDSSPLTILEGAFKPISCKECRWGAIKLQLRYTLNSNCVLCAQRVQADLPVIDEVEHEVHRTRHENGVKTALNDIMMLVQPDFLTRDNLDGSVERASDEKSLRSGHAALLHAIASTELEGTIWYGTPTKHISEQLKKRHDEGVQAIESCLLTLLMKSNCRRVW